MKRHEVILKMVQEMESKYGSLMQTPKDSIELKRTYDYINSVPKELSRPTHEDIDLVELQNMLDTGMPKTQIFDYFNGDEDYIRYLIKKRVVNDDLWKKKRARYAYRSKKEQLNKAAKEMGL